MKVFIRVCITLNAAYSFFAMFILLEHFDKYRGQNPLTATMMPMDVALGVGIILPISIVLTWITFRFWKTERNVVNIATVYSAIFGTLTAIYFLWTLK